MAFTQETHDLFAGLFWATIRLRKGTELYHAHPIHEIDSPYRWANSHIFRVPFTTFGLQFGRWHATHDTEEQAILASLSGREMKNATELEKMRARETIAANSKDLDEEWKIVSMADLMR
ncbi:hypothetical protein HWB05_gp158 [Streptomyces phage BRock]|uniref:Uncharacterized protein n=1 Tax=Streptomyces phage BRock TaxID=1913591 RepID=A0A1J0GW64_9CAUD|nr:hypothetical protein HWB05_gp158 [Streptomyces phage BRock]APC46421.1 hypothetical protein [Streptomyces phage BRock]